MNTSALISNTLRRKVLALLSVPLLAVPSAMGVQAFLEPESGRIASWCAAIGFEVLYIGINVLVLHTQELRRYGRNVALAAVATAVIFNTLAHYGAKVEGAYTGTALHPLAFMLSLLASVPLAGLAYAVSVLLHRISDEERPATENWSSEQVTSTTRELLAHQDDKLAIADTVATALDMITSSSDSPQNALHAHPVSIDTTTLICPRCGTNLDPARWRAARRWGHCAVCKPSPIEGSV
ncbi:MAG: hypothetical protein HGA19_05565 [Oscillochloris sp.]|jgi:hypothetical protein|nr:hypothetical protein [Oscillochloris sp.]